MLERYKFVLSLVWNILSKPDATLRYEALLNTFYMKNVFKNFIMPLAEILFSVVFITSLLYSEINIAIAIVKSIFNLLSFAVGYGALFLLIRWVTLRFFVDAIEDRNIAMFVGVLMSLVFSVNVLQALFPNLFFVSFLYIYVFYLVWVMSEGVVDISEDMRNKYMGLVSILVFVIPFVMVKLLNMLVPNL
jgi:hypothetical protein